MLNQRSVIIGSLLFLGVLVSYGIICYPWFFDIDDCGMIWSSRMTHWSDFFTYFIKGRDGVGLYFPSNYSSTTGDCRPFLGSIPSFYRPLTLALFGIQYAWFGAQPYRYLCVMIIFHAMNTVMIWLIARPFVACQTAALLAALFFAFHHTYWGWMGWIAAQPYTVTLWLLLVSTYAVLRFIERQKYYFLCIALTAYMLAVFTFEFVILFPVIILMLPLALPAMTWRNTRHQKITLGLFMVMGFFCIVRMILCPTSASIGSLRNLIFQLAQQLTEKRADVLSFVADIAHCSAVPGWLAWIKPYVVVLWSLLIMIAIILYRNKRLLLFFVIGMVIMIWPAILKQYTLRYLYYFLVFYVLFIACLMSNLYRLLSQSLKKIMIIVSCVIITFQAVRVMMSLRERTEALKIKHEALVDLVNDVRIHHRHLCFIGLPKSLFASGLAQHMWMLGHDSACKIWYDPSTFFQGNNHSDEMIDISFNNDCVIVQSRNYEHCWWPTFGGENMRFGDKHVINRNDHCVFGFSYRFSHEILASKPIFITWSCDEHSFVIKNNEEYYGYQDRICTYHVHTIASSHAPKSRANK